mmetsp:Transcript_17330/g.36813  ORF Transcript_17330/g.36813 Transcript_17330/m.36813 type:complete len:204 (-) Transcript_17330:184-795(-)
MDSTVLPCPQPAASPRNQLRAGGQALRADFGLAHRERALKVAGGHASVRLCTASERPALCTIHQAALPSPQPLATSRRSHRSIGGARESQCRAALCLASRAAARQVPRLRASEGLRPRAREVGVARRASCRAGLPSAHAAAVVRDASPAWKGMGAALHHASGQARALEAAAAASVDGRKPRHGVPLAACNDTSAILRCAKAVV